MRKRAFSPPTLPRPWGNYAHAVRVAGGATVYVAGQVGWDREGRMTSRELRGQIEQAFANVAAALEAAGAALADVVKVNAYMVDITQFPVYSEVRNRLFPAPDFPASTVIEVKSLAKPEWLIEIEAIAVVPERRPRRRLRRRPRERRA